MEDIITQLSAALVPLLGGVCGYLAGKLRAAAKRAREKDAADQKQQAALVDGVKSLLRGQIIDLGLHYIREAEIPPYGLDILENYYTAYVDLGDGDRSTHDIMQSCSKLPIRGGGE